MSRKFPCGHCAPEPTEAAPGLKNVPRGGKLWECSSPEKSPTVPPQRPTFPNEQFGLVDGGADSSAMEAPPARNILLAQQQLEEGRKSVKAALLEQDREVMTREESLLALTREAKVWQQRTQELQDRLKTCVRERDETVGTLEAELDTLRKLHRQESEELRSAKLLAEAQLQHCAIDLDESRQQLAASRHQVGELSALKEEMSNTIRTLQRRIAQSEEEIAEKRATRNQEHQASQQNLQALRKKFDALESLCSSLRHEKDTIEKQARQSLLELHDLRSKKEHRVLVDAQELYDKEQQLLRMEEQLQAAHMNNARLLRLMAESPDLHDILRFNEITQDFVFVGYKGCALGDEEAREPCAHAIGLNESCGAALTARSQMEARKRTTGGSFGIVAGKPSSKNAFLSERGKPALINIPNAPRQLHDAIADENDFLRRNKIHLSDCQFDALGSGTTPIVPPSNNLLECKSHEQFYWIPRAVLMEAQDFKQAYFPKLSLQVFFPFLVRLNHVWRKREQHLRRVGKLSKAKDDRTVSMERSGGSDARVSYEKENARRADEDIVNRELEALRREVRLKVSSKVAQHLCKQYEQITRLQIEKRVQLERQYEELAILHNHTLADRAPETISMQAHLRTLADASRSLSQHVHTKLVGASSDLRRFLVSLETASARSAVVQSGLVPASMLKQLVDCVKDFAEEVRTEATVTSESLSRVADGAERAATEVPPVGYQSATHEMRSAGNFASDSDDDDVVLYGQRKRAGTSANHARGNIDADRRVSAYDDLVDDVVLERASRKRF